MVFWSIRTTRKRHSRGKWPGTKWGPRARGYTDSVLAGNTGDAIDRETESRNSFRISLVSRPMAKNQLTNHPKGRLWKIVLIFERCENRGKRGGTANDVKQRGSLRRGSLIEEGISLCAKQASRIGVGGDGNQPKIGGSCPIDVYFRPRALGILSNSSTGHERNERSGRREKRRKQERKEGRKDVGRTKGRNAWKIDRFEKKRDRSFVDEWLPSASRWPGGKGVSPYGRCNWKAFEY